MNTPKNTEYQSSTENALELAKTYQEIGTGPSSDVFIDLLSKAAIDLSNELATLRENFMQKEIDLDACRNDLKALRAVAIEARDALCKCSYELYWLIQQTNSDSGGSVDRAYKRSKEVISKLNALLPSEGRE